MRTILAATDGSEGADRAVDVAAELTAALGGDLFILHVAGDLSEEAWDELRRSPSLEKQVGDAIVRTRRAFSRVPLNAHATRACGKFVLSNAGVTSPRESWLLPRAKKWMRSSSEGAVVGASPGFY